MCNEQYLIKAVINRSTADQSENEGHYHIAIGRHYYHFFLISKYNLVDKWKITEDRFKSMNQSTHTQFRSLLREVFNDSTWVGRVSSEDMNDLLIYMEDLCSLRAKAEYTNYEFNRDRYQSTCFGIVRKLDVLFKKIGFKE